MASRTQCRRGAKRCNVCQLVRPDFSGSRCPECYVALLHYVNPHSGASAPPPSVDPDRLVRIALYTARAAAGLPLFPKETK